MTTPVITPKSKSEIKVALTSKLDGYSYNYFDGDIRFGNRYARVNHYSMGNKIKIHITYWQDGIDHAIDYASICATPTGAANKISKFLDLK